MEKNTSHIIDKFGRKHDYLRISLTERCNLRCVYCMPEEGIPLRDRKEFMSAEETIDIAKAFVKLGVKKIRLTGGEPLIKKNFSQILNELSLLPVELALTTNGILVDKFIEEFKHSGLKKINVSLDSLKAERFNEITRRNNFQKIMENIRMLLQHEFDVRINVVLMKGVNEDEIIDFVDWTRKEKITIRFIEFMPFDGNNWNWEQKVSQQVILDMITRHFGENALIKLDDPIHSTSRNYTIANSPGTFGIISTVTNPFCDSCNRIRLTADGKIKNCLFSQSETDLLNPYRSGKEIQQLILDAILQKEKERGGLGEFSELREEANKNRSMISIGG